MRRYSAMRNAAAPSVGGDSSAPMPDAASMAPAVSGAKPTRLITGHATDPSVTVVATPLPDTVPSRNPASVTDRPADSRGIAAPRQRHREVEEELPGARSLEHRAVQAEQDDVRDRDVERHAVDALERHVEIADEARQVVAAMRDAGEADRREPRARHRVREKRRRGHRQNPAGRAPRGFEHDERSRATPASTSPPVGFAAR